MGNNNGTNWNAGQFPEDDEEERGSRWTEDSNSLMWKYIPIFPDTELLPIQPVYKPDVKELKFRREHKKITRMRSILFAEKDFQQKENPQQETPHLENGDFEDENTDNNNDIATTDGNKADGNMYQVTRRGFPTGRVYISVSHDYVTRRLKVAVIKAKNLSCKQTAAKDTCGINCSASYMEVSLFEGERQVQVQTTSIKKGYTEVLYYETFAFDINGLNTRGLSVEITAKHSNKQHFLKHSHEIGKVILEAQMCEDIIIDSHLVEALIQPGNTLYKWHTLWRY